MTKKAFLKTSFIAGLCLIVLASILKILHYANVDTWLFVGLLVWAVFIITALAEVLQSKRIAVGEKAVWIVGLLVAGAVTGIIYLTIGRSRVQPQA